jgi:hypothetical protein
MKVYPRKHLPHEIPTWADPNQETYFITINCRERNRNHRAVQEVAATVFETVGHRQAATTLPAFQRTERICPHAPFKHCAAGARR